MRSPTAQVPKAPHPTPPHRTSLISAQVNTRFMQNTPITITITITKGQFQAPIHSPSQHLIPYTEAPPQVSTPVTTQTVSSYNSFQDHLQSLPPTETFFLGKMSIPSQLHKLVSDIHNSCFAMASDGSVQALNGSFAWVLYGTQSQIHLTGHNTLTGGHSDLSTFREEACGYLGALYALQAILTTFPPLPNSPHITSNLHVDNLRVVRRSQDTPFSIQQCLQPDWDIIHKTYKVRASLPATITVLHVQSHQDETSLDLNSLSLAAHLSIFADSRTHKAYKDCPHSHQTPLLPSTPAVLVLNGCKVTSKMTTLASLAYYMPIMQDYFLNKFGWDTPIFSNIDWNSSEREYQCLSPGWRLASFKLQNGLWPTNKILHQRKQIPSPLCPRCNLYPETHNHVICCVHAQPIWLQQWNIVATVIKTTLNTPTSIYEALEFGICSWQEGESYIHWPFT
jgi:hypothetical protein